MIKSDEIFEEETKTSMINFNEKSTMCKTKNFYTLLAFLLITVALLIAVSIYCYLIKYEVKKTIYFQFTSQIMN